MREHYVYWVCVAKLGEVNKGGFVRSSSKRRCSRAQIPLQPHYFLLSYSNLIGNKLSQFPKPVLPETVTGE